MLNTQSQFQKPLGQKTDGENHIFDRWLEYNNYITFYLPDIDECDAQENPCAAVAKSVCRNTPGSYYCKCKDGFIKNDAICEGAI